MKDFIVNHSLGIALFLGFALTFCFSFFAHYQAHELGWKFAGDVANNILSEWFALFVMVEFTKVFREAGSPESKDEM